MSPPSSHGLPRTGNGLCRSAVYKKASLFFSQTYGEQIKRNIKLNWGSLAGSDSRESLAYEENDQISLCQLCLRITIFKSYPTSEVLCEQHCYGKQHAEGKEKDYNTQQSKLLTN